MSEPAYDLGGRHDHVFLGAAHARSERNLWAVIALCATMMVVEIAGGAMFGSIALVADGFHMSTHAGALLLAALAYTLARRNADDPRFTFGTGKFGDLAGFASAVVLAMIAALIAYESIGRLFAPAPIAFAQAIPIAVLGLIVNVASGWLLMRGGGDHGHAHGHGHSHLHDHPHGAADGSGERQVVEIGGASYALAIEEDGVPPRWRVEALGGRTPAPASVRLTLTRPDGVRESYDFAERDGALRSVATIPEPHAFVATLRIGAATAEAEFAEPDHGHAGDSVHRDNNMRAAVVHVLADAAVSVLVIVGLLLARGFGWLWMDPLAGLVGAAVIVSWSAGLIRDAGAALLDINPDPRLSATLRAAIEQGGDELADLHLWRLGPGHLGAILSVVTDSERDIAYYRSAAMRTRRFSHLTIEICRRPASFGAPPRHSIA
jgi:cation diffusion facilitator family transporter